jgi:hypothetical protein
MLMTNLLHLRRKSAPNRARRLASPRCDRTRHADVDTTKLGDTFVLNAMLDNVLCHETDRQLRHSCGGGLHALRQNASYDVFESPAGTLKSDALMPFTGSDATDFGGLLSIVNTKAVAATAKATLNSFNLRIIVAPGQ